MPSYRRYKYKYHSKYSMAQNTLKELHRLEQWWILINPSKNYRQPEQPIQFPLFSRTAFWLKPLKSSPFYTITLTIIYLLITIPSSPPIPKYHSCFSGQKAKPPTEVGG
jgi:hypothetical protein